MGYLLIGEIFLAVSDQSLHLFFNYALGKGARSHALIHALGQSELLVNHSCNNGDPIWRISSSKWHHPSKCWPWPMLLTSVIRWEQVISTWYSHWQHREKPSSMWNFEAVTTSAIFFKVSQCLALRMVPEILLEPIISGNCNYHAEN